MFENDIQLELRKFVAPEYIFGIGAYKQGVSYCKKFMGNKVLIVSDSGLLKTPWMKELQDDFQNAGIAYTLFTEVSPNPRDFEVMQGARIYQNNKCDIILAIGGGSVMDCAKGIGIVASNKKDIRDYEGVDTIRIPIPPLICIPTTGGTSADVSQFAIIVNSEERYKMAIISKALVPDIALIDPVLLTTMDPYLTACTGMDALSHAFEAFGSKSSSSFTDLYAQEAIKLIYHYLPKTLEDPENLQHRGRVMLASLYAGLAFSNASLGCIHSLSHSLGGYMDFPHGECNAILLPFVIDYNYTEASNRYHHVAQILDLPFKNSQGESFKKNMLDFLMTFKRSVGIAQSLGQKNVTSDLIPILSKQALKDPCNATNPREPKLEDFYAIFQEAM